jgi:hypothetical protein
MCSICAQTLGRVRGSELAEVPKGPEFTEITWRRVQKEHHSGSLPTRTKGTNNFSGVTSVSSIVGS